MFSINDRLPTRNDAAFEAMWATLTIIKAAGSIYQWDRKRNSAYQCMQGNIKAIIHQCIVRAFTFESFIQYCLWFPYQPRYRRPRHSAWLQILQILLDTPETSKYIVYPDWSQRAKAKMPSILKDLCQESSGWRLWQLTMDVFQNRISHIQWPKLTMPTMKPTFLETYEVSNGSFHGVIAWFWVYNT
jgi:hypothetical protein